MAALEVTENEAIVRLIKALGNALLTSATDRATDEEKMIALEVFAALAITATGMSQERFAANVALVMQSAPAIVYGAQAAVALQRKVQS